jgi:uncharacterized membrane protein
MTPLTILYSVCAAAMWAAVNHIDKYLLDRYFSTRGVGALAIFSFLAGLPITFILLAYAPTALALPTHVIGAFILIGVLSSVAFLCYFHALSDDDVSLVAPLFLLTPVIAYFIGLFLLEEVLSPLRIVGVSLVLVAAALLTAYEDDVSNAIHFRLAPLFLMVCASFLLAVKDVMFKYVAVLDTVPLTEAWVWVNVGYACTACVLLLIPRYRREFFECYGQARWKILGLSGANEILNLFSEMMITAAILLSPVALTLSLASGLHPIFVLAFALILAYLGVSAEKTLRQYLLLRSISIATIAVGVFLILS